MIESCKITSMSGGHYSTDRTHDITNAVPRESNSKSKAVQSTKVTRVVSAPEHASRDVGRGSMVEALEAAAATAAAAVTKGQPTSDLAACTTPHPASHSSLA